MPFRIRLVDLLPLLQDTVAVLLGLLLHPLTPTSSLILRRPMGRILIRRIRLALRRVLTVTPTQLPVRLVLIPIRCRLTLTLKGVLVLLILVTLILREPEILEQITLRTWCSITSFSLV